MIEMANSIPRISCLCITRNRVELLKKSILLFENQVWPNKELVIVYLAIDLATKDFLASINNADIKSVEVAYDSGLTLGDLRNISIAEASGDYICTWDDDDWFHPERLSVQIQGILRSGKTASVLLNLLILDNTTGETYISNEWLWEPSLMCNKKFIVDNALVYPSINKREDTYFLKKINSPDIIQPLRNPKMYIYCYTGSNTCSKEHFHKLFSRAQKLSAITSEQIHHLYNHPQLDETDLLLLNKMVIT